MSVQAVSQSFVVAELEGGPAEGSPVHPNGEDPPARLGREADGRGSSTLEYRGNILIVGSGGKRKQVKRVITPHRCRCGMCPTCAPARGKLVRGNLLELVKEGKLIEPVMVTLTADLNGTQTHRVGWEGDPQAAFEQTRDGAFVARLCRLMGFRDWVAFLEFQMGKGDEEGTLAAHWHILVDRATVRLTRGHQRGWFDYNRLTYFWQTKWQLGCAHVGPDFGRNGRWGVLYATKYMMKSPAKGYPDWAKALRGIRFVNSSRSLGPIVTRGLERFGEDDGGNEGVKAGDQVYPDEVGTEDEPEVETFGKSYAERMQACGSTCTTWDVVTDLDSGEETWTWLGEIPEPYAKVFALANAGMLGEGVQASIGEEEEWSESFGTMVKKFRRELTIPTNRQPERFCDAVCGAVKLGFGWRDELEDLCREWGFDRLPGSRRLLCEEVL